MNSSFVGTKIYNTVSTEIWKFANDKFKKVITEWFGENSDVICNNLAQWFKQHAILKMVAINNAFFPYTVPDLWIKLHYPVVNMVSHVFWVYITKLLHLITKVYGTYTVLCEANIIKS